MKMRQQHKLECENLVKIRYGHLQKVCHSLDDYDELTGFVKKYPDHEVNVFKSNGSAREMFVGTAEPFLCWEAVTEAVAHHSMSI